MGHHHHEPQSYNKAFAIATLLNLAFVFIEAIYALSANSMSLFADAGHNLGDVMGLLLAWGANWLLRRKPSERFSYGHKKTTILAALFNALVLVATSALIAYESIGKLIAPEGVNEITVMIVAFIGIAINGGTALLFIKGAHDDLNIKGAFLHLAYDALISVGVVVTGAIIYYTGWDILDPITGMLIVVAILLGTWGLLRDSVNLLLAAVPHNVNLPSVRDYLQQIDGVIDLHDLHVWALSTSENALTVHLVMPDVGLSDADYQRINSELSQNHKIQHVTIQVEKGDTDTTCEQAGTC